MGKGSSFVIGFSAVLILLFIIFSFLMATVNPPMKVSPDSVRIRRNRSNARLWNAIRKSGLEDIYYDDDVLLPFDNIEYGLDKTARRNNADEIPTLNFDTGKYTVADVYFSNLNVVAPPIFSNQNISTKLSTVKNLTKKSGKGCRRSIKEEKAKKRYLYLKIVNDDDPRLEIKLYSDNHLETKSKEHANNRTKLKLLEADHNLNNIFDSKLYHEQPIIKIDEDQTLVFNIERNSIKLLNKSGISFIKPNNKQEYFKEYLAVTKTTSINVLQDKDQEILFKESKKPNLYSTVGILNKLDDINTHHKDENSNSFSYNDHINMSESEDFVHSFKLNKATISEGHVLNGEDISNLLSNNVYINESSVNGQVLILNRDDLPNSFNSDSNPSTTESKDVIGNGDVFTNLFNSIVNSNVTESEDIHLSPKDHQEFIINDDKKLDFLDKTLLPNTSETNITYEGLVNEDDQPNSYSENITQSTEANNNEVFTLSSDEILET